MQRYFFDRVGQRPEYDYHGRDFPSPDEAARLAELIALDMAQTSGGEWAGWSVTVHDAKGRTVCVIRVPEPELADAA